MGAVTPEAQTPTGGSTSTTVTSCVHVAKLPPTSVTVHVTVVLPGRNTPGASLVSESTWQFSETCGAVRPTPLARQTPGSVSTVTSAWHSATGGIVSTTVTTVVQLSVSVPSSTMTSTG